MAEESQPKRQRTDPATVENIPDVEKSSPTEQNAGIRKQVIFAIAFFHHQVHHFTLKGEDPNLLNVSVGSAVHSICSKMFYVKIDSRSRCKLKDKAKGKTYKVTFKGKVHAISLEKVSDLFDQALAYSKLSFGSNNEDAWVDAMATMMDYLACYNCRKSEARAGNAKFKISDRNSIKTADMGLGPLYEPLLEGSTFPSEIRSLMSHSLGCLTQLICLAYSSGRKAERWKKVVQRTFAHFPEVDTLVSVVSEVRDITEIKDLLPSVGALAGFFTTRQANRYSPAPNTFATYFMTSSWIRLDDEMTGNVETQTARPKWGVASSLVKDGEVRAVNFNFKGSRAFLHYKETSKTPLETNGTYEPEKAAWIHFISSFGLRYEDIGLLLTVSDASRGFTGEELSTCFEGENSSETTTVFQPVQLKYYLKFANQTGKLETTQEQLFSISKNSGYVSRNIGPNFLSGVNLADKSRQQGNKIDNLIITYNELMEKERNKIKERKFLIGAVTTKWRSISSLTLTSKGNEVEMRIQGTGKFFLGDIGE